jgi:hypothetical protein
MPFFRLLKVRPSSSERAMTPRPTLLRSSFSAQVWLGGGRASGSSEEGSSRVGIVQWLVKKNAWRLPATLTPPEGTLKKPCLIGIGPVMVAGANLGGAPGF